MARQVAEGHWYSIFSPFYACRLNRTVTVDVCKVVDVKGFPSTLKKRFTSKFSEMATILISAFTTPETCAFLISTQVSLDSSNTLKNVEKSCQIILNNLHCILEFPVKIQSPEILGNKPVLYRAESNSAQSQVGSLVHFATEP